jgi:hypothetical protein
VPIADGEKTGWKHTNIHPRFLYNIKESGEFFIQLKTNKKTDTTHPHTLPNMNLLTILTLSIIFLAKS